MALSIDSGTASRPSGPSICSMLLPAFKDLYRKDYAILLLFSPNRKEAVHFLLFNAMSKGFLMKSFLDKSCVFPIFPTFLEGKVPLMKKYLLVTY